MQGEVQADRALGKRLRQGQCMPSPASHVVCWIQAVACSVEPLANH